MWYRIMNLSARKNCTSGFTLIELLVAMTVLSILVLFLSQLLDQATTTWRTSQAEVFAHDAARNVMALLQEDLATSITDELFPFAINNGFVVVDSAEIRADIIEMGACDAIYMVAASGQRRWGTETRDMFEVAYFVDVDDAGRGRLARRAKRVSEMVPGESGIGPLFRGYLEQPANMPRNTYGKLFSQDFFFQMLWLPPRDVELIMENVYSFEVTTFDRNLNTLQNFYSKDNGFEHPAYLEVIVTTIPDEIWLRRDGMELNAWREAVQRNAITYRLDADFPVRRMR